MTEKGTTVQIDASNSLLPGILLEPEVPTNKLGIILPGSGPQDLNGSLGLLKPYQDMAFQLAENGIATFRFNKRTYYYSQLYDITSPQMLLR